MSTKSKIGTSLVSGPLCSPGPIKIASFSKVGVQRREGAMCSTPDSIISGTPTAVVDATTDATRFVR